MIFKNSISFISFLTSKEMYGDLSVFISAGTGIPFELNFNFANKKKELTSNVYDILYEILYYNFWLVRDEYWTIQHINTSSFDLINNAGELEMVNSRYDTNHDFPEEEEEMIEQIKELLKVFIFDNYTINLVIHGKHQSKDSIIIDKLYLARFDQNDKEIEFKDEGGVIKKKIVDTLYKWASAYSSVISNGEYDFDSFWLDLSISEDQSYDSWCSFIEECDGTLISLSILEMDEEQIEVDFE